MNIAIFGKGVVGKATGAVFNDSVVYVDPEYGLDIDDFGPYHYAMLCIPTPGTKDGLDHNDLGQAILELKDKGFQGVLVIRSTCTPKFLEVASDLYHSVIYWPEFLRESTAGYDGAHPGVVVLGGTEYLRTTFKQKLQSLNHGGYSKWIDTDLATAAVIKLGLNTALAAKVSLFNSIYKIAESNNADWETVREGICSDWRIGHGQSAVPGPDGLFGFGGKCLPKDLTATVALDKNNVYLKSILSYNNEIRVE
jgi:UDP-glucose 6-dehydrogenase